ncbi:MAG: Uma2 family endonuclease, partial [Myxococcales bacterium]|nr:Uma2 family endonuclease [Myxococcales bacterium]
MADPARRRATYEDVLRAPENMVAQLVDGQLDLQPRPRALHARCASVLGGLLEPPMGWGDGGGPGGWVILNEPEVHFGEHVLVPDLAGWRRERMPELPDVAFFELAPDWVCEVLSPSTAGFDRVKKLPIYAAHGVAHAWLVDPSEKTLEVLELTEGSRTLV